VPKGYDLHLVLDNYATHKTPVVKNWLLRHPHFHLHFLPTSASWTNLVERWFAELTNRKATPGKSLRISWGDGTNVDVGFLAKGDSKAQVAVEHARLPDAEAVGRAKDYWKRALDRLREILEA